MSCELRRVTSGQTNTVITKITQISKLFSHIHLFEAKSETGMISNTLKQDPNTQLVKKNTNLIWQNMHNFRVSTIFKATKQQTTVKRWSIKIYLSGWGWGVLNTRHVAFNTPQPQPDKWAHFHLSLVNCFPVSRHFEKGLSPKICTFCIVILNFHSF